jgi:YD repeat-containing protein
VVFGALRLVVVAGLGWSATAVAQETTGDYASALFTQYEEEARAHFGAIADNGAYSRNPGVLKYLGLEMLGPGLPSVEERFGTFYHYDAAPLQELFYLQNQPQYSVQLGPVPFQYRGAQIIMSAMWNPIFTAANNPNYWSYRGPFSGLIARSGWSGPAQAMDRSLFALQARDDRALLKGYLVEDIVLLGASPYLAAGCGNTLVYAAYAYRYRYLSPSGGKPLTFFQTGGEQVLRSLANSDCSSTTEPARPTKFWSQDGSVALDVTNPCLPTMTYPDGTIEQLAGAVPGERPLLGTTITNTFGNSVSVNYPTPIPFPTCTTPAEIDRTDRNGNITRFQFPNDLTRIMIDPRGRTTTLTFIASPGGPLTGSPNYLLSSVVTPGPGGVPQRYTTNWTNSTVNFDTAMPDVACYRDDGFGNEVKTTCNGLEASISNVSSIVIPDGRSYTFQYGPWGNIMQVSEPTGHVIKYAYGNASNSTYAANSIPVAPHKDFTRAQHRNTGSEISLQGYGIVSTTSYPQGLSGAGYPTTTSFIKKNVNPSVCTQFDWAGALAGQALDNAFSSTPCCIQVWRQDTQPDGTIERTGSCAIGESGTAGTFNTTVFNALPAGSETVSGAGVVLKGNYYVNATGGWYYQYDADPSFNHIVESVQSGFALDYPLDMRTIRVDSVKDGLAWYTTSAYGDTIVPPGGTMVRNTLNLTGTAVYSNSALRRRTTSSYLHYPGSNILKLQTSTSVANGAATVASRTDTHYDEVALTVTGQPNLNTTMGNGSGCPVGHCRGNPTTVIGYLTPGTAAGPISSKVYYFDNGVAQKTQNPLDAAAGRVSTQMSAYNFGACASNPLITTTVVNVLSQPITTVSDCYSGATVSEVDLNNNRACMQIDGLGREVETAAPGDTLSAQPICSASSTAPASCFVRDTAHCTTAGTTIGNGGAGPTTWTTYYPFGIGGVTYNQARTKKAVRDGTSDGRVLLTFVDGLVRPIETCSEADPAVSSNNHAVCSNTVYDNMGRVVDAYFGYFVAAMPTIAAAAPSTDQYTETHYDGLGRVLTSQRLRAGVGVLPATTTKYTVHPADATNFPEPAFGTYVVDANGYWVESDKDVLGREILQWVETSTASNGFVKTLFSYDAADRRTSIVDPLGNVTSIIYDGLGRETQVADPDRGTWHFAYNDNGKMIQQTDARGAVTYVHYDVLNRQTLRDLPYHKNGTTWVAGTPGEEDEITYYDSVVNLPSSCYSCDDHCSTTTDSCNAATLSCTHTGTACAWPDQ